jgi:hypothetical protein
MEDERDSPATDRAGAAFASWLSTWVRDELGEGPPTTANRWAQIETLEPGWAVTISLTGTSLQDAGLKEAQAEEIEIQRGEDDWVHCWIDGGIRGNDLEWQGRGGAVNLDELLGLFRDWVESRRHERPE